MIRNLTIFNEVKIFLVMWDLTHNIFLKAFFRSPYAGAEHGLAVGLAIFGVFSHSILSVGCYVLPLIAV